MTTEVTDINGIDTEALRAAIVTIAADPTKGATRWQVTSRWQGGTRAEAHVTAFHIGGKRIPRNFKINSDEPQELCGNNQFANPQEYLLAALNACMIVGYTAACSLAGIELEELRIETEGDIDLRGFLGLDPTVKPGYDALRYTVFIKGNGTPEEFEKIHRTVLATSPNRFNLATAIPLHSRLVLGSR